MSAPRSWPGLAVRMALIATLSGLVAGLLVLVFIDRTARRREAVRVEDTTRGVLEAAAPSAAAACFTEDPALAQQVVDALAGGRDIRAVVLSTRAVVLAQAARPGPGQDLRFALALHSPFDPGLEVGELAVGVDPAAAGREVGRTSALFRAALAAALAALGAVLAWAIRRTLLGPIRGLAQAVRALDGQPGTRLAPAAATGRDELGELGREVDGLVDRLMAAVDQGRQREDRLAAAGRKVQAILDQAGTGIFVLRGDGALDTGNPAFLRRLGLDAAPAGTPLARLFGPEAGPARACLAQCRADGAAASALLRPPGSGTWQRLTLAPIGPDWIQGQLEDLELGPPGPAETLDPLTGALNRLGAERAIADHLANDLAGPGLLQVGLDLAPELQARREDLPDLLRAVRDRLAAVLGPLDQVARLEGPEFLVILGELQEREPARAIRRRLLAVLEAPPPLPGLRSAWAGLALRGAGEPAVADLMARAQAALAEARRAAPELDRARS